MRPPAEHLSKPTAILLPPHPWQQTPPAVTSAAVTRVTSGSPPASLPSSAMSSAKLGSCRRASSATSSSGPREGRASDGERETKDSRAYGLCVCVVFVWRVLRCVQMCSICGDLWMCVCGLYNGTQAQRPPTHHKPHIQPAHLQAVRPQLIFRLPLPPTHPTNQTPTQPTE